MVEAGVPATVAVAVKVTLAEQTPGSVFAVISAGQLISGRTKEASCKKSWARISPPGKFDV